MVVLLHAATVDVASIHRTMAPTTARSSTATVQMVVEQHMGIVSQHSSAVQALLMVISQATGWSTTTASTARRMDRRFDLLEFIASSVAHAPLWPDVELKSTKIQKSRIPASNQNVEMS